MSARPRAPSRAPRIAASRPVVLEERKRSAQPCACGRPKHRRARICRACYEGRVVLTCPECGTLFERRRCRVRLTCGTSCERARRGRESGRAQARKELRVCEWCGRQDMVAPSRAARRFCTTRCSNAAKQGRGNGNWKGGISTEGLRLYGSPRWKKLCRKIWQRDAFACRRCSKPHRPGRRFEVHHIGTVREYPSLKFDAANLALLCNPCHRWVHSKANEQREWLL